jgi:asparagine synthase (glutamine-hydrolysing)
MKGILPETIRTRRDKIGFGTPENAWLREKEWIELAHTALNSDLYRDHPILDLAKARRIHACHVSGKCNAARKIWKWINLYLWHSRFIAASEISIKTPERFNIHANVSETHSR